ncbi:MAG: glycoside hydrolase family 3 protein [bacterium]|nr:glycoside hydrolase family 3 protein [bacterium]
MKNTLKYTIFLLAALAFLSCGKKRMYEEADAICGTLTLEQKLGQMLMSALPGRSLNPRSHDIIKENLPGGIIFFKYNLGDQSGIKQYISDLQEISMKNSGIPLFVSVDQEGGRVFRITDGATEFPGAMAAGVADDADLVYDWGKILGMELRLLGVNMNLAPVLDVNNNPENPVINTRSFGSETGLVSRLGVRYIEGIQESSCIAVGKHFPGHGDTNKDSHNTLPVIPYSIERLKKIEFPPFVKAIDAGVEGIMTAHIAFPAILKNDYPATLSPVFLTDILRKQMKFQGIVMTDDMEMDAISKNTDIEMDMGEAAVQSVLAGADIVLISTYGKNIDIILTALKDAVKKGILTEQRVNESVRRIIELKLRYKILSYKKETSKETLKKASLSRGAVDYSDEDREILQKARQVNKSLSQKAIYYHGNKEFLKTAAGRGRIIVSPSRVLKNTIKKDENTVILGSLGTLYSYKPKKLAALFPALKNSKKKTRKISLFYHIRKPNLGVLKRLDRFCEKNNLDLVVVSSGDPFPLARSGLYKAMLLSFSGTEGSVAELAHCINGNFEPKTKIGLHLGVKEEDKDRKEVQGESGKKEEGEKGADK